MRLTETYYNRDGTRIECVIHDKLCFFYVGSATLIVMRTAEMRCIERERFVMFTDGKNVIGYDRPVPKQKNGFAVDVDVDVGVKVAVPDTHLIETEVLIA